MGSCCVHFSVIHRISRERLLLRYPRYYIKLSSNGRSISEPVGRSSANNSPWLPFHRERDDRCPSIVDSTPVDEGHTLDNGRVDVRGILSEPRRIDKF